MALPEMVWGCCLEGQVGVGLGCGGRSRWERWLPLLTSTGGQCNIKVPPDCSVPHTLKRPFVQESGSASYIWNPWWAGARPGGLRGM